MNSQSTKTAEVQLLGGALRTGLLTMGELEHEKKGKITVSLAVPGVFAEPPLISRRPSLTATSAPRTPQACVTPRFVTRGRAVGCVLHCEGNPLTAVWDSAG